jgi:hypothetical protein
MHRCAGVITFQLHMSACVMQHAVSAAGAAADADSVLVCRVNAITLTQSTVL